MTTTESVPPEALTRSSKNPEGRHDHARDESLSLLCELLRSDEAHSRNGFAEAFKRALRVLELDDYEAAKIFQISRPTVGRWTRGDSSPHPVGRQPILKSLEKRAERKRKQNQKQLGYK